MSLEQFVNDTNAIYSIDLEQVHERHANRMLNTLRDYVNKSGVPFDAPISIVAGMGTIMVVYNGNRVGSPYRFSDYGGVDYIKDDEGNEYDLDETDPLNAIAHKRMQLLIEISDVLYGANVQNTYFSCNMDWNYHLDGAYIYNPKK